MLLPARRIALLVSAGLLAFAGSSARASESPGNLAPRAAAGGIGIAVSPAGPGLPEGLRSPAPETPCYVLIPAGFAEIRAPERLDPLLKTAAALGLRVVIRLTDDDWQDQGAPGAVSKRSLPDTSRPLLSGPPKPSMPALPKTSMPAGLPAAPFPLDEWIARTAAFATRAGELVDGYQILDAPAGRIDPRLYAYLLKRAAVALRAARPGARIISAPLGADDTAWVVRLFAGDVAPYLDIFAARGLMSLEATSDLRDRLHPRAALWVVDAAIDPAAPKASITRAYFDALSQGVDVIQFAPPEAAGLAAAGDLGELLTRLRGLLKPGLSLASPAALPFNMPAASARSLAFYEAAEREGLMVYRSAAPVAAAGSAGVPGEAATPETATPGSAAPSGNAAATVAVAAPPGALRFALRVPVDWLVLYDPETGAERPIAGRVAPGTLIELPLRHDDLVLRFRIMAEATPLREALQVGTEVELTAEEIIAKEREVRAAQMLRLQHYEAEAPINIHYRISSLDTSVDILTENRLYVHDGKQDYVETALYVDGARWRGTQRPSLPFLAPETVKEIPLDIVLDEGYRYSLLGKETISGQPCYVIGIDPAATDRSLYKGKVYIDRRRFHRLRMDAVQTNIKDPLRSNHVTYEFGPIASPAGEFWLPVEVRGQMVFELLGQNLVVEREVHYRDFRINREGIADRVAAEYASPNPIFRDTPEGYYEVDRRGGTETLQDVRRTRNTFLVMGANIGYNGSPGLPFAGVNFFDFDFHGTGTQFDVAWAGPFVDLSWTDPRLTRPAADRRPLALTLGGTFNALAGRDKNARANGTDSAETIDYYDETVRADLSLPMGHFAKWTVEARADYFGFQRRDETDDLFVVPRDTVELGALLRLEYNRRGAILAPWVESGRRSSWGPWGLPGAPFEPGDRDFTRRGIEIFKSFYPALLHKISIGVQGFDGAGLDRFSRFELGDFRSARVLGFNGSGIHFDRGLIASAGYAFTIARDVRVDAGLEAGWIRSLDDFGPGYERVMGAGLAFEFSGPWSTLANVRIGQGISSTIPGKGRSGDIRVVFFKTWDKWNRKPKP